MGGRSGEGRKGGGAGRGGWGNGAVSVVQRGGGWRKTVDGRARVGGEIFISPRARSRGENAAAREPSRGTFEAAVGKVVFLPGGRADRVLRRTGALDDVALVDAGVAAEAHDADVVVLEVERHALDAGGELDHLAGLNLVQAVHARDAVAHGEDAADLVDVQRGVVAGDAFLEEGGELLGGDPRGDGGGGVKPAPDRGREPILGRQGCHRHGAQRRGELKSGSPPGESGLGAQDLTRGAAHHLRTRYRCENPNVSSTRSGAMRSARARGGGGDACDRRGTMQILTDLLRVVSHTARRFFSDAVLGFRFIPFANGNSRLGLKKHFHDPFRTRTPFRSPQPSTRSSRNPRRFPNVFRSTC